MTTRNVRFWVYVNSGPVKLTLRPGQCLHWWQSRETDEGWSGEGCTWGWDTPEHESEVVRNWIDDGRDCDGRFTRTGLDTCQPDRLMAEWPCTEHLTEAERQAWRGVRWPQWERDRADRYDEYAEAAGY